MQKYFIQQQLLNKMGFICSSFNQDGTKRKEKEHK